MERFTAARETKSVKCSETIRWESFSVSMAGAANCFGDLSLVKRKLKDTIDQCRPAYNLPQDNYVYYLALTMYTCTYIHMYVR